MDLGNIGSIVKQATSGALSTVDRYVPGAQAKIKNLADKAKAYYNNMTDLELKVMEATNHEPWGPHGSAMQGVLCCCWLCLLLGASLTHACDLDAALWRARCTRRACSRSLPARDQRRRRSRASVQQRALSLLFTHPHNHHNHKQPPSTKKQRSRRRRSTQTASSRS